MVGVATGAFQISRFLWGTFSSSLDPIARIQATTSGRYDTAAYRLDVARLAFDEIAKQPIWGTGLDHDSGMLTSEIAGSLQVHNILLLAWLQGGLVFLVGILGILALATKAAWSRSLVAPRLHVAMAGAAVSAIAFAMTSPILFQRYLWLPVDLVLASIALSAPTLDRHGPVRGPTGPMRTNPVPTLPHSVEIGHGKGSQRT
jgi:O-antigen ligase